MKAKDLASALGFLFKAAPTDQTLFWRRTKGVAFRGGCIERLTTDRAAKIKVDGLNCGEACVAEGDRLMALLRKLGDVEVSVSLDSGLVVDADGGDHCRFALADPDDLPGWPEVAGREARVPAKDLAEIVERVKFCTDRDVFFGCVWLEGRGEELWAVAADNVRLAAAWIPCAADGFSCLVPGDLAEVVGEFEGEVTVTSQEARVALADGRRLVTSPTYQVKFVDWRGVLDRPREVKWRGEVSKAELLRALRLALAATKAESATVELGLEHGAVEVEADSGAGRFPFAAVGDGECREPFNPAILAEALEHAPADLVRAELCRDAGPALKLSADRWECIVLGQIRR